MMTIGTLFSGFGGVDIGAMAAGLAPLWGIEYDADIADVARRNLGDHIITADILDVDPATLPAVDVLHASPPCPNFSVAKAGAEETEHDFAMAAKVAEFIRVIKPRIFTLENVYGYRKSKSWHIIRETLNECGYWMDVAHVNAADFGVPQTRKRMIVRAVLGGWVPMLPPAERWVGWYEAIEDLIPTLPESQLAPWQVKRLPDELNTSIFDGANLVGNNANETSGAAIWTDSRNPAQTVRTDSGGRLQRAVLDNARVVAMTPRCLARFQSFPDWYELPEKRTLAARGIGNAVPPLLYEKIIRQLVESVEAKAA